ncbi:MAG: hypothetical protein HC892_11215 [Saprospiraceae bacterium]|nr:hypothetical protein [Saprospiraceae bacterium]
MVNIYTDLVRYKDAEALLEVEMARQDFVEKPLEQATLLVNKQIALYNAQNRQDTSINIIEDWLLRCKDANGACGKAYPDLWYAYINTRSALGDTYQLKPLYDTALVAYYKHYAPTHPSIGNMLWSIASDEYYTYTHIARADSLFDLAKANFDRAYGINNTASAQLECNRAILLQHSSQSNTIPARLDAQRKIIQAIWGKDHPNSLYPNTFESAYYYSQLGLERKQDSLYEVRMNTYQKYTASSILCMLKNCFILHNLYLIISPTKQILY